MQRALALSCCLSAACALRLTPARLISDPRLTVDAIDPRTAHNYRARCPAEEPCYWLWATDERERGAELFAARQVPPADDPVAALLRLAVRESGVVPVEQKQRRDAVGTRLLLSDESVNVWEFRLAAGEACAYHRHELPYCFVNLTESLTQSLRSDGSDDGTEPRLQRAGDAVLVPESGLGAHGVRNVGNGDFLQFVVERKV